RPNMYDLSLKTPGIIKWPGVTRAGMVIKDTTRSLDLFPTILEMAGIEIPKDIPLRGRSLVPLLKGRTPSDWPRDFYAEYHMINYVEADMRCYRTPEWKLIRDFKNEGRDELYYLAKDPKESKNLIEDNDPDVRAAYQLLNTALMERKRTIEEKD
ncbi:MAG: DUF4976 domain-containing protein, partial [Verrucomicrobiae bacterium]|nr:DUF4976 domain-containing protein [Verrucomicrobiae bacterium]